MDTNELGEYIKRQRTRKKMTLGQLSEKINYSAAYISMVENGKKNKPSYEFLSALAKGLNANYHFLLHLIGDISYEEFNKNSLTSNNEKIMSVIEEIQLVKDGISEGDLERLEKYLSALKRYGKGLEKKAEGRKLTMPDDLNRILSSNSDLFYKETKLTDPNKQNLIKFIETFIIEKGE